MGLNKNEILDLLKQVQDPSLRKDIVSLGMVRDIQIQGPDISVELLVASGSEKFRDQIKQALEAKLGAVQGVGKIQVSFFRPEAQGAGLQDKNPLPGIEHIIAVSSGKGGVGKTTVSVNLACALLRLGFKVGLMDGDIYGPNVPLMLGVAPEVRPMVDHEEQILPIEAQGLKMISMGVLVAPDQPMVWRGPRVHGAITQFLQNVRWGELDFLIVDLPPGTGDIQLSLSQIVPLSGAVMVTTPQEVSILDVRKGITMFQKTQVPILGIVENMAGEMFGSGGGSRLAVEYRVPFLGSIPLDVHVRKAGDGGSPVVLSEKDSPVAQSFMKVAEAVMDVLKRMEHAQK